MDCNLFWCPSLCMAGLDVGTATKKAVPTLYPLPLRGKALVCSFSQAFRQ